MKKKIIVSFSAVAAITAVFTLLLSSRKMVSESDRVPASEEVTAFNYERLEGGLRTLVSGEAATISEDSNTVKKPAARFETADNKIILVDTGPEGTAEISLDSETGRIEQMVLKGGVKITRKDRKSGQTEFTAESERADFEYAKQEIILTGKPVVRQGENEFRGEIIRYLLKDGKIYIDKYASGKIYYEEKKPSP